jgi:5-methylcytosine-specific restriction endonuclease McrA
MTITQQLQTIACGSTHPLAVKAAAEFPAKLFSVHGDKIKIRDSAVYYGNGTTGHSKGLGIDVACSICGNEWSPIAYSLLQGCGCPKCAVKPGRAAKRGAPSDQKRAAELRAQGLTYAAIGEQLGKARNTIRRWLDKDAHNQHLQYMKERCKDEAFRDRVRVNSKRYYATDKGKALSRENSSKRDLLKRNIQEYVYLDNSWQEVDRKETWSVFGEALLPSSERKAIQELYLEAQYLTETTGIEHHVDHIQPLSKGGEHLMFNLQILPAEENLSKNNSFREEDQIELAQRLFNIN